MLAYHLPALSHSSLTHSACTMRGSALTCGRTAGGTGSHGMGMEVGHKSVNLTHHTQHHDTPHCHTPASHRCHLNGIKHRQAVEVPACRDHKTWHAQSQDQSHVAADLYSMLLCLLCKYFDASSNCQWCAALICSALCFKSTADWTDILGSCEFMQCE
jgi:hypothetical protein